MIAVFQGPAATADKHANLVKMLQMAVAASAASARLVVFPELFLSGYNISADQMGDIAEPLDGPSIIAAQDIARNNNIGLLFGFPERADDKIFNSAALVNSKGEICHVYRKVQLFGAIEPTIFSRGTKFEVVEFPPFRIGVVICYDIEFPEISRKLAEAGANFIAVPTANMAPYYDVPTTLVRARALENGVVVAYSNLIGTEGDLTYTGLSAIVGSDGMDLARAGTANEALLIADVSGALARPLIDTSTQIADLQRKALQSG